MNTNKHMNPKIPLQVLIRPNTRELLSEVYQECYKYKYSSFSIFIEEMLLIALREIEVLE